MKRSRIEYDDLESLSSPDPKRSAATVHGFLTNLSPMKTPTKPGKSQYFTDNLADETCNVKIVGFQPGIQKELLIHVAGANQQMPAAPVSLQNCIVNKIEI